MMVKREALEKVGPMPDCYFLYYEEFDWSMMFRRKGYELWYEPTATIFHKESRATGQDSPLKTYYLTRNRLLFVKRNVGSIEKLLSYIYNRYSNFEECHKTPDERTPRFGSCNHHWRT